MNNQNLVPAIFYFENKEIFFGLHNPSNRWNGWANPLISKESINHLLEVLHDDEYLIAKMEDNNVYLLDLQYEDNEADILEPIEIGGKIYYDFGWLGYCFEAKNMADYEGSLHQQARDLMDEINESHNWDSKLSLDEYLFNHFDDLTNVEMGDIQTLLDKFYNL